MTHEHDMMLILVHVHASLGKVMCELVGGSIVRYRTAVEEKVVSASSPRLPIAAAAVGLFEVVCVLAKNIICNEPQDIHLRHIISTLYAMLSVIVNSRPGPSIQPAGRRSFPSHSQNYDYPKWSKTTHCTTPPTRPPRPIRAHDRQRLEIYKFNNCGSTPSFKYEVLKMTQPGLSYYAANPANASGSSDVLLAEALRVVTEPRRQN